MNGTNNNASTGGRMQRIVSQAGYYASALASDATTQQQQLKLKLQHTNTTSQRPYQQPIALRARMSGAINAISLAPDGEAVVIAGRESKPTSLLHTHTNGCSFVS